MLVRALLLLTAVQEVFSGGTPAKRKFMMRPMLGADRYKNERCGYEVTPDFIERCYYTDCFKTSTVYTRNRRALGGALMKNTPDCDIDPTFSQPEAKAPEANLKYTDCLGGQKHVLARPEDPIKGDNVCDYRVPNPVSGNKKCYCRTLVCKVITMEDKTWKDDARVQGSGDLATSCNFIVRIEDAHGSPKVPGYAMWLLFGIAALIAFTMSFIFMAIYGTGESDHAHGHGHGGEEHGGEEHGSKEHGHGHEKKESKE